MKLLASFMLLVCSLLNCGIFSSYLGFDSASQRDFLNNPCKLPCLYDVQIDTTSKDEVIHILKGYFNADDVHLLTNGNIQVCITQNCKSWAAFAIEQQTAIVKSITIGFAPQTVYCSDYYAFYGSPTLFFDVGKESMRSYLMLYDDINIEVVLVPLIDHPDISWIENIYIHNAANYEKRKQALLNSNAHALKEFTASTFCQNSKGGDTTPPLP